MRFVRLKIITVCRHTLTIEPVRRCTLLQRIHGQHRLSFITGAREKTVSPRTSRTRHRLYEALWREKQERRNKKEKDPFELVRYITYD